MLTAELDDRADVRWVRRLGEARFPFLNVTCAELVNELVEDADERMLSRIVTRYGRAWMGSARQDRASRVITEREERAAIGCASNLQSS